MRAHGRHDGRWTCKLENRAQASWTTLDRSTGTANITCVDKRDASRLRSNTTPKHRCVQLHGTGTTLMSLMYARELCAQRSYQFSLRDRGEAHLSQNTGLHANVGEKESENGKIHKDIPTLSRRQPGALSWQPTLLKMGRRVQRCWIHVPAAETSTWPTSNPFPPQRHLLRRLSVDVHVPERRSALATPMRLVWVLWDTGVQLFTNIRTQRTLMHPPWSMTSTVLSCHEHSRFYGWSQLLEDSVSIELCNTTRDCVFERVLQ